jgi:hypothetical protein
MIWFQSDQHMNGRFRDLLEKVLVCSQLYSQL